MPEAGGGCSALDDATHDLYSGRLKKTESRRPLGKRLDRLALRHPRLGLALRALRGGWRVLRRSRTALTGFSAQRPETRGRD
jgi:hypothetical protein